MSTRILADGDGNIQAWGPGVVTGVEYVGELPQDFSAQKYRFIAGSIVDHPDYQPPPDWDGFSDAIQGSADIKAAFAVGDGFVAQAVFAAMASVSEGNTNRLPRLVEKWNELGLSLAAADILWLNDTAEAHNIPISFDSNGTAVEVT